MDELITLTDRSKACGFCNLTEVDEFKYGPLFQRDGFVAHYYCVLFSYKMQQRGEDDEGILGFLISDIRNEVERVKKILCVYCKKPNASISCTTKRCGMKFHFPCGVAKGSLHQFKDSFKSYCFKHRPVQEIPEKALKEAEENQVPCAICYDSVNHRSTTDTIWANCCCTTWYHRDCLQRHALSSGYFFKCAICNNNKKFKNWVEKYGIFVPKKDASWELEPNAFGELSRQYCQCDANNCKCPNGRDCDIGDTMWEIILCRSCGSQGVHIMCGLLKFHKPVWQCDLCRKVTSKIRSERMSRSTKTIRVRSPDSKKKNQLEGLSDGDCSTSNSFDEISRGSNAKSKNVRGNRYVKKRKRTDAEDGEKSVKRKYRLLNTSAIYEKADTEQVGSEKDTKLNVDLGTLRIKDFEIEKSINEVNEVEEKPVRETNSAEDEDSDDLDDCFPLEEIKRRKKIEEDGLEVIDLTVTPSITEEEVMEVMQVYRNYQMTDLKYRVKKEILVISDDETDELEVVDSKETQVETGEPQNNTICLEPTIHSNKWYKRGTSTVNISLSMKFHIGRRDMVGETKVIKERTVSRSLVITESRESTNQGKNGKAEGTVKVKNGKRSSVMSNKRLVNFVDDADVSKTISVSGEKKNEVGFIAVDSAISSETSQEGKSDMSVLALNNLETLNNFERDIEKLIRKCLRRKKKKKSKHKRGNSINGKSNCGSSEGREMWNEDNDVEIIDVIEVKSKEIKSGRQQPSVGCSKGEEDIIEIE